jgi:cell division protease FtsH
VRALIEAAHTEAWEILNPYRDVLDELVFELLQKETLVRKDLERIFDRVEKRPRITAFNDFGGRTPSDKPPILTPAEQAKERGEPWPPQIEPSREPTPVGSYPGGGNGVPQPGPAHGYPPAPGPYQPAYPQPDYSQPHPQGNPPQQSWATPVPSPQQHPNAVPHNYGAPPDWRPATTPSGQSWPPAGQWQQPPQQGWVAPPPESNGNGHSEDGPDLSKPPTNGSSEDGPR